MVKINVRSIKNPNKAIHFEKLLAMEQFDIVFVNETWLDKEFQPINKNFNIFQNTGNGYRGTLITIKQNLVSYKIQTGHTLTKIILDERQHLFVGYFTSLQIR